MRGFSVRGHVAYLGRRIRRGDDVMVLVTGDEGYGKSTLCLDLGAAISRELDEPYSPASLEEGGNVLYTNVHHGEMMEQLEDWILTPRAETGSVCQVDELQWLLFSREFASSPSREAIKLLMTARAMEKSILACIPHIRWVDLYIRGHRGMYWWYTYAKKWRENGRVEEEKGWADYHEARKSKYEPRIWWEEMAAVPFPRPPPELEDPYVQRKMAALRRAGGPTRRLAWLGDRIGVDIEELDPRADYAGLQSWLKEALPPGKRRHLQLAASLLWDELKRARGAAT